MYVYGESLCCKVEHVFLH